MINEQITQEALQNTHQAVTYAMSFTKQLNELEKAISEKITSIYNDSKKNNPILNHKRNKVIPLKDLYKKGQLENINVEKTELRKLKKELNRYGVKFSVTKDKKTNEYVVFFQAKDNKVMDYALKKAIINKEKVIEKPSTIALIKHFKELANKLNNQKEKAIDNTKKKVNVNEQVKQASKDMNLER